MALCPSPGASGGRRTPLQGEALCCGPVGACCAPTGGACAVRSASACSGLGGIYYGDGTTCAGRSCTGACCAAVGTCTTTGFGNCSGGTFQGLGTVCSPNPCPVSPTCCQQGAKCYSTTTPTTLASWQISASGFTSHCCGGNPVPQVQTPVSGGGGGSLSPFMQPSGLPCDGISFGPVWVDISPQPNCSQSSSGAQRVGLTFNVSASDGVSTLLYHTLDITEQAATGSGFSQTITCSSTVRYANDSCSVWQRTCRTFATSANCNQGVLYDITSQLTVTLTNRRPCPGSGIPSVIDPGDGTVFTFERDPGPAGLLKPTRRVIVPGAIRSQNTSPTIPGGCGGCGAAKDLPGRLGEVFRP